MKPGNGLGRAGLFLSAGCVSSCVSNICDLKPCVCGRTSWARLHELHHGAQGVVIRLLVAVDQRADVLPPTRRSDAFTGNAFRSVAHSLRKACHMLSSGLVAPDSSYARLSPWRPGVWWLARRDGASA